MFLVLLAIGRTANVAGIGLEKIGVHVVNKKVLVDENEQTNLPHIYALGDCATGKYSSPIDDIHHSLASFLLRCYSTWKRSSTSSSSDH